MVRKVNHRNPNTAICSVGGGGMIVGPSGTDIPLYAANEKRISNVFSCHYVTDFHRVHSLKPIASSSSQLPVL